MHHDLQLIAPSDDMQETYEDFLRDFRSTGEMLIPWVLDIEAESFPQLVRTLQGYGRGEGLRPGLVNASTYWLIDAGRKLLAVSNLRHGLTPELRRAGGHVGYGVRPSERGKGYGTQLLALTLNEARKLGIERALLVCDKTNLASAAVIRRNGGTLESEERLDEGNLVQRYWIDLSTRGVK